jgi:hypothetical protein
VGEKLTLWDSLKKECGNVTLRNDEDVSLIWTLSPSGVLSVKFFYTALSLAGFKEEYTNQRRFTETRRGLHYKLPFLWRLNL